MQYIIAILIAIALYMLQAFYYKRHWKNGLTVDISYNRSTAHIGDTIKLTEQISNRKRLPLPVLYVKFKTSRSFQFETEENAAVSDYYYRNDVFSILGNQQVTRTLSFRTSMRGYFTIDSVNLVANDLFMRKSYAYIQDNHAGLYVYPRLLRNRRDIALANSILGDILTQNLYEDPLSFRGIRDYTSSDSLRFINWKATAKKQQLMVNTYFDTRNTDIVLLVNLDTHTMQRMDTRKEYTISVAATLINHMITQGFSLRLAVNAPDIITGEPVITVSGAGNEHLHVLFQNLARIDLSKELIDIHTYFDGEGSVFDEHHKEISYLVLSNYRKPDLLEKYLEKQNQGYSMHFVCPEYPSDYNPDEFHGLTNVHYWEVTRDEA